MDCLHSDKPNAKKVQGEQMQLGLPDKSDSETGMITEAQLEEWLNEGKR